MSGSTLVASTAYSYDAANQLVLASDGNSSYTFAYGGDGNVLTTDNAGTPNVSHVVLTGAFDAAGNRTSLSATVAGTADLLNNYSYDADQRMTMLTQQGQTGGNVVSPNEVDFAYNALGQFTSIADFNTLSGARSDVAKGTCSYDTGNRLAGLAYTSNGGATSIDTFGWGYNNANNVTSFTSADGEADYGYDPTNQLTSATYTTATGGHQPASESYSFDSNGNRNSTGYSTAADNLMTSDGTFNYTHDADGNTTSRTRISSATASDYLTTYSWDYRNRLTDVEYYDNSSVLTKHVHYVYDVFDHLLATQVDTTGSGSYNQAEHYVLDVSPDIPAAGVPGTALAQPLFEFDASDNLAIRYLEAHNRNRSRPGVAGA
jgi:YD repeat-containing protein